MKPRLVIFLLSIPVFAAVWHFSAPQPKSSSSIDWNTAFENVSTSVETKRKVSAFDAGTIHDLAGTVVDSVQGKIAHTAKNARLNTGLTDEQLNANRQFTFDAFYNPETSSNYQADLHKALTNAFGAEEADFLSGVTNITNWEEMRDTISARASGTGQNYDDLMLNAGLANGNISSSEVAELANRGVSVPSSAPNQLVRVGRVDTLVDLARRGLIADVNYQDPYTGANALSTLIQNIGYVPGDYEPEQAAKAVKALIELGVETQPQNGSFDPLDYSLQVNRSNADVKLAMAKALLDAGVPFQQSHRQLLANMPDSEYKKRFLEAFANRL